MLENLKIGKEYEGFLFLAEAVRNPPVLRPHYHAELELNLVVSGEVTYVMAGQRYRFPKRSLLWFFPSQEHQLVDRSSDAAYYVAVFTPDLIRRACRGPRYAALKRKKPSVDGVLHSELKPDEFEILRREMAGAAEDGLNPDLLNREAGFGLSDNFRFRHNDPDWLNAVLRHLLLFAWRLQHGRAEGGRAVPLHPVVRRALRLLESEDLGVETLDSLADACGVSASFLSRRFHHELGVTLSRYRNSLRLGRFWETLRSDPSSTYLDAVLRAGFGSYSQFYRVYVAAYGTGPRESARPKVSTK
jgi:AraC-like DNA-binding protein